MRHIPGKFYVATYSHTDSEVKFLLTLALGTGVAFGAAFVALFASFTH